jgi:hypothetical protein
MTNSRLLLDMTEVLVDSSGMGEGDRGHDYRE